MSILREELITNHLLLDYFDLWDEFDIKSANDAREVRYYNLLMNLINNQLDAGIKWLDSDNAREYFFGENEYQRGVFESLEGEWNEILSAKYPSIDALLSEVYRRGKSKGYSDMRSRIRFTDSDKQALKISRDYNYHLIRKIDNDVRNQIKNKITEAVIAGEHPNTLAPKILSIAEERLENSNFTPRQRATMIARTEVSRVQNTGILQSYINEGYTEIKILTAEDDHVCDLCLRYAFEYNSDDEITFANRGEEKVHNIIKLIKNGLFPPFHPLCRCTYLSVWKSKGSPPEKPYIINLTPLLKTDDIETYFKSDNTPVDELNTEKVNEELSVFREFTNDSPIEKAEFWDINGVSMSRVFYGNENEIIIPPDEVLNALNNGAKILIHNHPNKYNNVHSISDIKFQLAYNIKYCIVESYSQRFIIQYDEGDAKLSREKVFSDLDKFENEFREKIKKDTDEEIINYDIGSMDDNEYYELRDKIWKEKYRDSHYEYQQKLSSFFNEDTGLTLYVHDVEKRE